MGNYFCGGDGDVGGGDGGGAYGGGYGGVYLVVAGAAVVLPLLHPGDIERPCSVLVLPLPP